MPYLESLDTLAAGHIFSDTVPVYYMLEALLSAGLAEVP
jgi:hypothetical protein